MKLLLLGGTRFVGRHFAEEALARGHDLTLFHRGQTNPGLFPGARELLGDRDLALPSGRWRRWDTVLDFCGYVPRQVRKAAAEIEADRYVFISSISVYADFSVRGLTEDSPVKQPPKGQERTEEVTPATYGWLKALCERELDESRSLIVRPGILVGPHDYTGRFTYWPWRVAQGGEVQAPGRPGRPVQLLDARDLAGWLLKMVEKGRTGTFNAPGPGRVLTMGELLETCREVTGSDATFTWVDGNDLDLPLWIPEEKSGFDSVDNGKARAEGLAFRPLADTIRDTLAWVEADPEALRKPA
ncbi:MAG TPA: epimerase [Thermoanaerobaculia bacterium]|nr:epimerase [Thermoanaerobaculia bacterium]